MTRWPALRPKKSPSCTGSVGIDLIKYLDEVARFLSDSPFGRIAASVIGAAIDDPALADAARAFWFERRAVAGSILERAVARGDLSSGGPVDLLVELLVGPIYYRWLVLHEPTDLVRIREIVRRVLFGHRTLAEGPDFSDRPPPS